MRKKNSHTRTDRVGTIGVNNLGSVMKIVEYDSNRDIWVTFGDSKPIHTSWRNFQKGEVRSPYDRTVYGVGFLGEGDQIPYLNGKLTLQYKTWQCMIRRCYLQKSLEKNPSYIGCSVSEDWHNFQNFARWFDENYYEVEGEQMHLDKDILIKGNKVYSPDTCIFVPQRINVMFVKANKARGEYPLGVTYDKSRGKFSSQFSSKECNIKSRYNTPEEAFYAYKINKENHIKKIAEEYKDKIPEKLYNAMITYEVEITD